jgi:hypothetical protein
MNPEARAILFMNRGNGVFEPKPTTFSGLDSRGICAEAADLNNDGLLDLVFAADPDNSGIAFSMAAYESKVYWNTGEHGGKNNHWLRLRFSGISDAELIGARVELVARGDSSPVSLSPNFAGKSGDTGCSNSTLPREIQSGDKSPHSRSSPREIQSGDKSPHSRRQYRWIHANHSYKSGGALEVHFGLGKATRADITVTLLSGKTVSFAGLNADQYLDLNLRSSQSTPILKEKTP